MLNVWQYAKVIKLGFNRLHEERVKYNIRTLKVLRYYAYTIRVINFGNISRFERVNTGKFVWSKCTYYTSYGFGTVTYRPLHFFLQVHQLGQNVST